mgnify:CR=1 FL=1
MIYLLLIIIISSAKGFFNKFNFNRVTRLNADKPPELWLELSNKFKKSARNWFISRAEKSGINWRHMVNENKKNLSILKYIYNNIENKTIEYPEYYTQSFHGYDTGNLNWDASLEGEAATLSMAVNYWKGTDPIVTENWLRYNVTNNIKNYGLVFNDNFSILDVGCSVGISTEFLYKGFPFSQNISGIDLSPYFLSTAVYRSNELNYPINYFHKNAEDTGFSSESYDLIVCNFILHEVPMIPTKKILNEMFRLLKPNGVLAVVDLDPKRVRDNLIVSTFRKWAFEVTEPHIYEYYKSDMKEWLIQVGLKNVDKIDNDPINAIWIGKK